MSASLFTCFGFLATTRVLFLCACVTTYGRGLAVVVVTETHSSSLLHTQHALSPVMATVTAPSPSSMPLNKSGKREPTDLLSNLYSSSSAGLAVSHQAAFRSSLVPLPPIPTAPQGPNSAEGDTREKDGRVERRNPFLMPPESELFTLRERQRREAREQRAEQRKLKVHEKSTYSSRLNAKNAALRKTVRLKIKMQTISPTVH